MKKIGLMLLCIVVFAIAGVVVSCDPPSEKIEPSKSKLSQPTNFRRNYRTIEWDEVKNADGYVVLYNNIETKTSEPKFELPEYEAGKYEITVFAYGDNKLYIDSKPVRITFEIREFPKEGYDKIGLHYTLLEDKTGYEVDQGKAGKNLAGTLVIPEMFNDLPVKKIAANAFLLYQMLLNPALNPVTGAHCNTITTKIVLPSTLESIEECGFACMTKIEELEIPDSVKTIGEYAFYGCINLKRIRLPKGLKEIPDCCFQDCNLEEIDIPNSVETIGVSAFMGDNGRYSKKANEDAPSGKTYPEIKTMSNLKKVVIPQSVKTIGNKAFNNCINLEEIILPKGLRDFGRAVFDGTKWYESQPDGYVILCDDILYEYKGEAPEKVVIPGNIKYIASAFAEATIKEAIIPDGVKLVGQTFYDCTSLTSVRLSSDQTEIPKYCFYGCKSLKEIELPATVERIGDSAFRFCRGLKSIELPAELKEIGVFAFSGISITEIKLPKILKALGERAFDECEIAEIVVPHSLKEMGRSPFPRHTKAIYYEGTMQEWETLVLQNNNLDNPIIKPFYDAKIYYYSEETPATVGDYWHYVDNKPTPW